MQCALLLGWLFTSQTRQLLRSDGEDGVAILSDFLEISNRHPRLILWSILQHLKCKGEWLWPFYGWKSNCDEFYIGWVGFRELGFLQTLSFLICMTFMPWKTVFRTQLLLSFARIKGLLFIAPGIYGYVSCLDLFGDNFSPAPQRAWKSPLWKNFLLISTNSFKRLFFSCLCVYSTGAQIYVEGNVISQYFSLKQLYIMKMEAEGVKFSDAAF